MKKMHLKTFVIAALLAAGILTGCENTDSPTGNLKIQLTDAPFPTDSVAEANVTINKIEARKAGDDNGNPFVVLKEEEMSFNLLDLTNGVTENLVDLEIDTGSYDLVRLYVSEASVKLNDSTEFDLFVPSGAQTGIKIFIDPAIVVEGGLTSELLLDFNVSKSFIVQGNQNTPAGIKGFIFKPVIKASNLSEAGRLTGMVTDAADNSVIDGAEVSVIAADTVYTTSFTDEYGAYTILGIDEGTYKVEFGKESYQTTTIEDVDIAAANVTTLDAQLIAE